MEKNRVYDLLEDMSREAELKKDLESLHKREDTLIALRRNNQNFDIRELEELWATREQKLKELDEIRNAKGKLKSDLQDLEKDERLEKEGNELTK